MILMRVLMSVMMIMIGAEMNIELGPGDAPFVRPRDVKVVTIQLELGQFLFQAPRIEPKIDQRPNKHVPANPAK